MKMLLMVVSSCVHVPTLIHISYCTFTLIKIQKKKKEHQQSRLLSTDTITGRRHSSRPKILTVTCTLQCACAISGSVHCDHSSHRCGQSMCCQCCAVKSCLVQRSSRSRAAVAGLQWQRGRDFAAVAEQRQQDCRAPIAISSGHVSKLRGIQASREMNRNARLLYYYFIARK